MIKPNHSPSVCPFVIGLPHRMKVQLCLLLVLLVLGVYGGEVELVEREKRDVWSKVGLAWCDWDSSNMWALAGNGWNQVSWSYTWSVYPNTATNQAGLDFVPMMWGTDATHINDYNTALNAGVFNGRSAFLAFNEPDQAGQANLSPAAAVTAWNQYIQPLKAKGLRLGAPAVSNAGKAWLQQFISQCGGCTIDFIPLHWYGSSISAFTAYVTDIHNTFGKPIWITEFACAYATCSASDVATLMGGTTDWLDQQTYVERFAWFGSMKTLPGGIPTTDQLLTTDGQSATSIGLQYAYGGH